ARESGVHPSTLARAFRAWTGDSIGGYVRRLRLELALALIARHGRAADWRRASLRSHGRHAPPAAPRRYPRTARYRRPASGPALRPRCHRLRLHPRALCSSARHHHRPGRAVPGGVSPVLAHADAR
ncbi:helix-turn-helix domain-containing protein, partial [Massilia arenosa]